MCDSYEYDFRSQLDQILAKSPKQFSNIINHSSELAKLKNWIIQSTPKLDSSRSLTERIYWIINGIQDFPRCQNKKCNQHLTDLKSFRGLNLGYKKFCCKKCSNSDPLVRSKNKASRYEKNGGKYFSEASIEKARQAFIQHYGVDNNMKSKEGIREYQDALERKYGVGIRNQWQRSEIIFKAKQTRLDRYGSETWNNPEKTKATKKKNHGSENYYNLDKAIQTFLRNYGVEFPMQNPEIARKSQQNRKARSMYELDGFKFDSYPEMCFYIYYRDHGIPIDCHPKDKTIQYFDKNGYVHTYYPDFYLPHLGYLVEIKGNNHFRDKDPTKEMISLKGPEYDHVEQSKQACMKEYGVMLVTSDDYSFYVRYAQRTYGHQCLSTFRVNRRKMWKAGETIS